MNRLKMGEMNNKIQKQKLSLVKNLLVPLEIKDFAPALVAFHNSSLVDLPHVQVERAPVAEGHRVAARAFKRPCRRTKLHPG